MFGRIVLQEPRDRFRTERGSYRPCQRERLHLGVVLDLPYSFRSLRLSAALYQALRDSATGNAENEADAALQQRLSPRTPLARPEALGPEALGPEALGPKAPGCAGISDQRHSDQRHSDQRHPDVRASRWARSQACNQLALRGSPALATSCQAHLLGFARPGARWHRCRRFAAAYLGDERPLQQLALSTSVNAKRSSCPEGPANLRGSRQVRVSLLPNSMD